MPNAIITKISCDTRSYSSSMKDVKNTTNSTMQNVEQSTNKAAASADKLGSAFSKAGNKIQLGGIKLNDVTNAFGLDNAATSAMKLGSAFTLAAASIDILLKGIKNIESQFKGMDEAAKSIDRTYSDAGIKIEETLKKQSESTAQAAAELKKLILSGDESLVTKTKEEQLLEKIREVYKDITLEGKSQVDIAKMLSSIEEERYTKAAEHEERILRQKIRDAQEEISRLNDKMENKNSTSVLGSVGQWWMNDVIKPYEQFLNNNPLLKYIPQFASPVFASNTLADYGLIPGVQSTEEEAKTAAELAKNRRDLTFAQKDLREQQRNNEILRKNRQALNESALEEGNRKVLNDIQLVRSQTPEQKRNAELLKKMTDIFAAQQPFSFQQDKTFSKLPDVLQKTLIERQFQDTNRSDKNTQKGLESLLQETALQEKFASARKSTNAANVAIPNFTQNQRGKTDNAQTDALMKSKYYDELLKIDEQYKKNIANAVDPKLAAELRDASRSKVFESLKEVNENAMKELQIMQMSSKSQQKRAQDLIKINENYNKDLEAGINEQLASARKDQAIKNLNAADEVARNRIVPKIQTDQEILTNELVRQGAAPGLIIERKQNEMTDLIKRVLVVLDRMNLYIPRLSRL